MILRSLTLLAALAVATDVSAQCSKLTATGGASGTDLKLELTGGTKSAMTWLVLSQAAGTTELKFGPLGTLKLDLESPVFPIFLGRTDRSGDLTRTFAVPKNAPAFDLKGQAVNLTLEVTSTRPPQVTFKFCVSNVADIKGGG